LADRALARMDGELEKLCSDTGRPSIAPERLLRATLLMILYSIRGERQLMEQMNYNLPFRWFVGLEMDDAVRDATVFTKNRERLIAGAISQKLLESMLGLSFISPEPAGIVEPSFPVRNSHLIPADRAGSVRKTAGNPLCGNLRIWRSSKS
jgi:hypothetical protein